MTTNYSRTGPCWLTTKAVAAIVPLLIAACSHRVDDCHYTLTCGDFTVGGTTGIDAATTGGAGGTGSDSSLGGTGVLGGSSGIGGISSAGDTGGSGDVGGGDPGGTGAISGSDLGGTGATVDGGMGGYLGDVGGMSGLGGIGGTGDGGGTGGVLMTCNPPCQNQKPVCLQSSTTCVQCTGNEHCSSPKPYCDHVTYTCAECTGDEQCSGIKSHCDLAKDTCVECTGDGQCSGTKSHCDLAKNTCVECTDDGQCSGTRPYCDLVLASCVECLDSADCTSPGASVCLAGKCSPCATNNDCSHLAGKSICDTTFTEPDAGTESGTCVECTGTENAACSGGDAGTPRVCDSLKKTCTDEPEHSAGLCQPCVSDAQCVPGTLCVEQLVHGVKAGYFCFFKQGDTTHGAPTDCTLKPPYVKILNDAISIDEAHATVCGLAVSSCTAMNQFRQTSCALVTNDSGAITPDDTLCGVVPGVDSKCQAYGSQFLCTVTCLSNLDCKPGVACNTGVLPNRCNFQ